MDQSDFLEAQLKQAQAALEVARRLQRAAEEQRNAAVEQLRAVAASLLSTEWNLLRRDHPEATDWTPEQLGGWIIDTGTRKLNRLELLGGSGADILETTARERDQWQAVATNLQQEISRLSRERDEAISLLQARNEENRQLREEIARLNRRIAELSASRTVAETLTVGVSPGQGGSTHLEITGELSWLAEWQMSPDYARDVEVLRVIGQYGYVLRESVMRALGMESRTGTAARIFDRLREREIIGEKSARLEGRGGKSPNLLFLTEKGKQAYRVIFGQEPVEPEDERLLRRHKSEEQVMLALQARTILEEHKAEMIDLFPDPQPLPGGGVFEVDLIAVLDGQRIFVELERAPRGLRRVEKWERYARLTRAFYFFVPNKDALNRLMTEISHWAYHHSDQAAGVIVHICQVSGAGNGELWQVVRTLVGKP